MVLTQTLKMVKIRLPSEKRLPENPEAELAAHWSASGASLRGRHGLSH